MTDKWKCNRGGCSFDIPAEFTVDCVCAALAMGKITQIEIEKAELVYRYRKERERVRREIEATAKALPELIEKLNAA